MSRLMFSATLLIGLSALLHVVAPFLSDFSDESVRLLPFFLLYAFLAWHVAKDRRWASWLGFLLMLFGGIAGLAGYLSPVTMPGWLSLGIWATNWLAAICLFVALWCDRSVVESAGGS